MGLKARFVYPNRLMSYSITYITARLEYQQLRFQGLLGTKYLSSSYSFGTIVYGHNNTDLQLIRHRLQLFTHNSRYLQTQTQEQVPNSLETHNAYLKTLQSYMAILLLQLLQRLLLVLQHHQQLYIAKAAFIFTAIGVELCIISVQAINSSLWSHKHNTLLMPITTLICGSKRDIARDLYSCWVSYR